jgi:short chain dehydrogenase
MHGSGLAAEGAIPSPTILVSISLIIFRFHVHLQAAKAHSIVLTVVFIRTDVPSSQYRGGGRGIGAATATLLAARGASVVVNYLKNATTASQIVAQIHANGGQALAVQADIRDQPQAEALVQATRDTYGRIDMLVDSASPSGCAGYMRYPFKTSRFDDDFSAFLKLVVRMDVPMSPFQAPGLSLLDT